jgi:hypothetical protein
LYDWPPIVHDPALNARAVCPAVTFDRSAVTVSTSLDASVTWA